MLCSISVTNPTRNISVCQCLLCNLSVIRLATLDIESSSEVSLVDMEPFVSERLPTAPFWRKCLFWPIATTREILWSAISSSGVPLMLEAGISESMAATYMAVSGLTSVVSAILVAHFSGMNRHRCQPCTTICHSKNQLHFPSTIISSFSRISIFSNI